MMYFSLLHAPFATKSTIVGWLSGYMSWQMTGVGVLTTVLLIGMGICIHLLRKILNKLSSLEKSIHRFEMMLKETVAVNIEQLEQVVKDGIERIEKTIHQLFPRTKEPYRLFRTTEPQSGQLGDDFRKKLN